MRRRARAPYRAADGPASNWARFAEKARELFAQDEVAVGFGCWTAASRKSVLPLVEALSGLLFCPVQ